LPFHLVPLAGCVHKQKKEKEGLLSRAQNYMRDSSGMSLGSTSANTPKVDHTYDQEGRRTDSGYLSRFPSFGNVGRSSKSPAPV
jgi:hypothetical protein